MLDDMPDRSLGHAATDRQLWTASLQVTLLAAAAMVLAAWLAWLTVPARWVTPGYPSQIGYGKNVELAGLLAGALVAIALALVCFWRPLRWRWVAPPVLCGFSIALSYGRPETIWALPLMLACLAIYFAWFLRLHVPPGEAQSLGGDPLAEPWPRWCSVMACLALAALCFARAVWPIRLDGFHQGEVVLTALDWLKGGRPFETIFWPHGMHDTWLTAKLMEATGNEGIGSVVLSRAITQVLGLVTLQVTAFCLLRRWADAVWMTALVALLMPDQIYQLGVVGPAILPLAMLARRINAGSCVLVGALLGWAFLWRFDSGVFGLAAALSYVALIEFYTGYASGSSLRAVLLNRHRWQAAAGRIAALVLGVTACFAVTRLAIGLPTWQLLRMTLLELPRYHADNTGFPLSLPIAWLDPYAYQDYLWTRWFTPAYLLFTVLLVAALVRLMSLRRYALATLSDRYFLAFGLFVLFQSKTMLDRAGPHRLGFSLLLLGLLILFDLLSRLPIRRSPARVRLAWSTALALVGFGIVLPQAGALKHNGLQDSIAGVKSTYQAVRHPRATFHHLRTLVTPTAGWQDLLEPTRYDRKHDLHAGVHEAIAVLRAQRVGDRKLAIVHSGPILYPVLGIEPATRYYMLGWAMNDAMQREAVADLQSNGLRAVLRVSGLGGTLPTYDIPDESRVPIIDGFLKQRSSTWPVYHTRLGALHVEPGAEAGYWSLEQREGQWSIRDSEKSYPLQAGSIQGCIDLYGPDGDGVKLAGWAANVAEGTPAQRLLIVRGDQVVLALPPFSERRDVAAAFAQPGLQSCGFHLTLPQRLLDAFPSGEMRVLALSTRLATEIPLPGASATLASQPAAATTVK